MPIARDIVDALECVISVYFSHVRHNHRAAFLLCDELVEMICKTKMRATHPNAGRIGFFQLLNHPTVGLNPSAPGLGEVLNKNHETRNHMQHATAAATVDDQHCADAILDAVQAMDHCFPGASTDLPETIKIALRVVRLHSMLGDRRQRMDFGEAMQAFRWNAPYKHSCATTMPLSVGSRPFWGYVIMSNNAIIAKILEKVGAP